MKSFAGSATSSFFLRKAGLIFFLIVTSIVGYARSSDSFLEHLRYLASDELKGRKNGSLGLEQAASYIAEHFQKYGLLPAGDGQTYFQEFELTMGRRLGPENGIALETGTDQIHLKVESDYVPLTSGPETTVQGPLVFAGFGISAPELNYDDYRGLDVRRKIVLVFEHEPQEQSKESLFRGRELTPYATDLHKILNAKSRGAAAVLLLPDSFNHPESRETGPAGGRQVEDMGIHSVKLAGKWGEWLLHRSGRDPVEIAGWINSHLTPYSFGLGFGATVSIDVVKVRRTIKNVLGLKPGQTEKVIIIGAHYDHLGLGDKTSLAPELIGEVHNGADDNASGTAGLLRLAQDFGRTSPHRGLLFIAFAGEELGLLGSRYYAQHPTIALEKTMAMINMDMIGRSDGDLLVGGVGTAAEFKGILDDLQKTSVLQFTYSNSLRGSSDHLSFSVKKIPVLFFFSGLHSDYHRPSDDWERIDLVRTKQVLEVVHGTIDQLAALEQPPQYVDLGRQDHVARSAGRGHGPRLGSFPDMSWELDGVRFEGILAGSPAEKAGLRAGDILVGFDGRKVKSLYDFTTALGTKVPGDEVEVVVLRDGQIMRMTVHLDARH
ncbi:M28 family peptidase [Acidobacteria bacterium AH-259-A15]|nr:M28 family peptidase [Acidobacteria bacterium AH-259-A15]